MGVWCDDIDYDECYIYVQEWSMIVNCLWSEECVDFEGKYFKFEDCVFEFKFFKKLFIVCVGQFECGFCFMVCNVDVCFVGGKDDVEICLIM